MSEDTLFGSDPVDASQRKAPAPSQPAKPILQPLAERLRPRTLDDVIGQKKLLGPGAPLRGPLKTAALTP